MLCLERGTHDFPLCIKLNSVPSTNCFSIGKFRSYKCPARSSITHRIGSYCHFSVSRERRRADALPAQLIGAAPFEAPFHEFTFIIFDIELDPGVWIGKLKFLDGASQLQHFFTLEHG